jgi:magnesium transporter
LSCKESHAKHTLAFLPPEHQVAILASLDAGERQKIEQQLEAPDRERLTHALSLKESAVGRLATPMIWRAARSATAADALQILRDNQDSIEVAANLHVVDDGATDPRSRSVGGDRLVGLVPLRVLSVSPPESKVEDLMTKDPLVVREDAERSDAAEIMQTHDFLSLPIVDAEGRLVGAVRIDDLLDAALRRAGAGILNQGGVSGDIAATTPYFQTSLFRVVRSRITWLVLLFVAETATGTVLRHFEDELAKVVALSFFIPLLIGTGGNAGSQTVSTVIRALAVGEVRLRDVLRVLAKEVATGFLLGLLLGTIALFRAKLWGVDWELAMCVGVTVLVVCTWANTVGSLIPIAAQRVGIDPTVVSAPLITTLVDASGLFIYLSVAKLMISSLRGG